LADISVMISGRDVQSLGNKFKRQVQ